MRLSARLVPVLFIPLALFGAASCSTGTAASPGAVQSADPATSGATGTVNANTTVAVRVTATSAAIHADPDSASKVLSQVGPTTKLGSKTTLLALDVKSDWVEVALPVRPNGSTGWLKKSDVQLRTSTRAITVDRATKKLVLSDNGEPILTTQVAIGSPQNPTPAGSFYVTDLLDTGNGNGAYGPFAFGLSGHSDTLSEFGGGDGQLGIHGTNEPDSIGQAVSHGCVRVPNDIVKQLVGLVPLGTPVTIS